MRNYFIMFGLGAFAYGLIEIIWRGYSHWTMMIAGGICFIVFSLIEEKFSNIHLLYKCILGSLTVSSVELAFGSVFNIGLGLHIWDYSNVPINLFGQICLLYSVLWGFLSVAAIPFAGRVLRKLKSDFAKGSINYELSAQSVGGNKS